MAVFKDPPNPNRHFAEDLTELGAARKEVAAHSLKKIEYKSSIKNGTPV